MNFNGKGNNQFSGWNSFRPQIKSFTVEPESICAMRNGNDIREYVDTTVVPGTSERSLLDTGAGTNAISAQLIAEYGLTDQILDI